MKQKIKKPRDLNRLSFAIVEEATQEEPSADEEVTQENIRFKELGRLGGLKGGKVSSEKLTSEERSERARRAARIRWAKKTEK